MAKADKRRQKGGWRHTLLCCRFSWCLSSTI